MASETKKSVLKDEKKVVSKKRRIKNSKIRLKTDKQMNKEAVIEENVSLLSMLIIVIICIVVGIFLAVILYDLALSSSGLIFNDFLKTLIG